MSQYELHVGVRILAVCRFQCVLSPPSLLLVVSALVKESIENKIMTHYVLIVKLTTEIISVLLLWLMCDRRCLVTIDLNLLSIVREVNVRSKKYLKAIHTVQRRLFQRFGDKQFNNINAFAFHSTRVVQLMFGQNSKYLSDSSRTEVSVFNSIHNDFLVEWMGWGTLKANHYWS